MGYQKVCYSRANDISTFESPFWQRAEITRGDFFRRRDVGVTLDKAALHDKLHLYAGIYSGQGEEIVSTGDNDASGRPEYIARAEYAWPAKFRDREVDYVRTNVPHFLVGVNGRYADKAAYTGSEYGLATINGQKRVGGADFEFQYKGFTLMAEAQRAGMTPRDTALLNGKATRTRLLNAGGFLVAANYYYEPLKSVLAVRYDTFNPNDLVLGDALPSVSVAYMYLFDQTRSALRIVYSHRLKDENAATAWQENQLRVGYQMVLR